MAEQLNLIGTLEGHEGWVTALATPTTEDSNTLLSASRGESRGPPRVASNCAASQVARARGASGAQRPSTCEAVLR